MEGETPHRSAGILQSILLQGSTLSCVWTRKSNRQQQQQHLCCILNVYAATIVWLRSLDVNLPLSVRLPGNKLQAAHHPDAAAGGVRLPLASRRHALHHQRRAGAWKVRTALQQLIMWCSTLLQNRSQSGDYIRPAGFRRCGRHLPGVEVTSAAKAGARIIRCEASKPSTASNVCSACLPCRSWRTGCRRSWMRTPCLSGPAMRI